MPWFKRSYRGLYGNRMIQFGNQVSFAENKTRRTWKPNVQKTTLWSKTLGEKFQTRLTTYVMRCIKKHGGFDEYLLNTRNSVIKFPRAIQLKERIIAARRQQEEQRALLDGGGGHVIGARGASGAIHSTNGSSFRGVVPSAVSLPEVENSSNTTKRDTPGSLRPTRPSRYADTCRGLADLL